MVVRKNEEPISNRNQTTDENLSSDEENAYSHLTIVHVFDHCIQDSEAIVAILRDVLIRTKRVDGSINNAFIRSDNAGCFHSAQTILSLPQISYETNIRIQRIDFCDPRGGKGPCDRYAPIIKSHVRRFLNEKHNVTTAAEFVEATFSNEGIRGVYTYEARLNELIDARPFQLPKIGLTNNFSLEPYGVHVHRSWKVGSGKFFPFSKTDRPDKMSSIVCSDTPRNKTVLFATAQTKKKQRDLSKQYIDNHKNVYVSRLFDCY